MLRHACAAVLVSLAAMPAGAQEPPNGPSLPTLVELAAALGEAHAIRTLCNGDGDQTWREYMMRLLDLEAPANPRRSALTSAFNRGYRSQSSRHSACTADLVQEEARIGARGRQIAESIVRTYLQ
jgi:uncharacterized protein (TIGR02301 family)